MKLEFDILNSNYGLRLDSSRHKYGWVLVLGILFGSIFLMDSFMQKVNMYVYGIIVSGILFVLSRALIRPGKDLVGEILSNKIGKFSLANNKIRLLVDASESDPVLDAYCTINTIRINHFYGEVTGFGRYKELHFGTDSLVELNVNGETKKYYLFIRDEEELKNLQLLSTWCLESTSDYKEYTKGERTYFGKKLNYKQIQALKKSTGINTI